MGLHFCHHPYWHRALILFGTVGYFHAAGYLTLWLLERFWRFQGEAILWGMASWLVSTWLFKHLLQWRCQGREPSDGRRAAALMLILGSAAWMTHDDDDY